MKRFLPWFTWLFLFCVFSVVRGMVTFERNILEIIGDENLSTAEKKQQISNLLHDKTPEAKESILNLSQDRETPLIRAIKKQDVELIEFLVGLGAKISTKIGIGEKIKPPLFEVFDSISEPEMRLAVLRILFRHMENYDVEVKTKLQHDGNWINVNDTTWPKKNSKTPLSLAIESRDPFLIGFLLVNGADVRPQDIESLATNSSEDEIIIQKWLGKKPTRVEFEVYVIRKKIAKIKKSIEGRLAKIRSIEK